MIADLDILEKLDLEEYDIDGSKRYAHLAEKTSVTEGYVLGTPVMAACGKLFIPSRDPKKYPICPICKEIMDALFLSDLE